VLMLTMARATPVMANHIANANNSFFIDASFISIDFSGFSVGLVL
jgi:hypothetical protein